MEAKKGEINDESERVSWWEWLLLFVGIFGLGAICCWMPEW
jgi:hypothetical protein